MSTVIRAVMKEAKEKAGSADRLVKRMAPALRKSDSAISAYITGTSVPPADVFLEAARVMQIPVDRHLFGESLADEVRRMRQELDELKGRGPAPRH